MDLFPYCTQKMINEIFADKSFYMGIGTYEGCLDIINDPTYQSFYSIKICTVGTDVNIVNKEAWRYRHIFGDVDFLYNNDEESKCNTNMNNGIQIDDKTSMLSTNANIRILMKHYKERQYNQIQPKDNVYIANDWDDIRMMLDFFIREPQVLKEVYGMSI